MILLILEPLEAIVRLLIGLISKLLCLKKQGGPKRGREKGEWGKQLLVEQPEHTQYFSIESAILYQYGVLNIYSSNVKDV